MLIEEFEEELKKKKRKKKITVLIIVIVLTGFASIILYNRFNNENVFLENREIEKKQELIIFNPTEGLKFTKMTLNFQQNVKEKEMVALIIKTLKELKAIPEKLTLYESGTDENGIIYANFSKELIEETKEPKKEIATVFSLVNTFLANIPNAKAVQFLVEGQPIYTLNGLIYTYKPIFYNNDLLEE